MKATGFTLVVGLLVVAVDSLCGADTPAAPYDGPRSGTLECRGSAIPQNAEYVFRNVPNVKLQLEYDKKTWETRLIPIDEQTQKLIVKNIRKGPQKTCIVHWSVLP